MGKAVERRKELFSKPRNSALQKDSCKQLNAHKGFLMARIKQEIFYISDQNAISRKTHCLRVGLYLVLTGI